MDIWVILTEGVHGIILREIVEKAKYCLIDFTLKKLKKEGTK